MSSSGFDEEAFFEKLDTIVDNVYKAVDSDKGRRLKPPTKPIKIPPSKPLPPTPFVDKSALISLEAEAYLDLKGANLTKFLKKGVLRKLQENPHNLIYLPNSPIYQVRIRGDNVNLISGKTEKFFCKKKILERVDKLKVLKDKNDLLTLFVKTTKREKITLVRGIDERYGPPTYLVKLEKVFIIAYVAKSFENADGLFKNFIEFWNTKKIKCRPLVT